MSEYTVYKAAGWHGEPIDPVILRTDDEREARMRAGCRIDIHMPGFCNRYDAYATDEDGDRVEPIESFQCEECGGIEEWGEDGPIGTKDGRWLECVGSREKHTVTWVCQSCADGMPGEYEEDEAAPGEWGI